ncbi:hypothetical protein ABIB25_003564 [Nakamurella sp. UYEF19]
MSTRLNPYTSFRDTGDDIPVSLRYGINRLVNITGVPA